MKTQTRWKDILLLQVVFLIYSITSLAQKSASAYFPEHVTSLENLIMQVLNPNLILRIGLVVFLLALYAFLWQQVIKRFELSIAYANKSVTLAWALLWGFFLFHEDITWKKLIGVVIVMLGICILNSKGKETTE